MAKNKTGVMHVITQLPGGGVERLLVDLLPRLNHDAFEVCVCCTHKRGALADVLEEKGVSVHLVKIKNRWDPVGIFNLMRLMRSRRIRIVHAHMYASSISGGIAAKFARVPVIIVNMHSLHEWHTKRRVWMAGKIFNLADRVVGVSDVIRDNLIKTLGLNPHKVITIHNGIDLARFKDFAQPPTQRRILGIAPDELVIGAVGRLVSFKGFTYLLAAAKLICAELPKFKLVIVGGGELDSELKRQAQDLGIAGKVVFTGPQADVRPFLALFDVAVLSSISEGFGIAVLEAMAMGKAVVATRVGGLPEVVADKISGLLVSPENPEALAIAISNLLGNPGLRVNMGQAGKARAEELFSIQQVFEQTIKLYRGLLRQKDTYDN
jgi:glycosyltransferase involved in cell wall biosynthesis